MKIGCHIEGIADRCFVEGLLARYCQHAELIEPIRRGGRKGKKLRLRHDIRQAVVELRAKRADYIVILTDADNQKWRDKKNKELDHVPDDAKHIVIFGVPERNIECWIACDRRGLATFLQCSETDIPNDNPKSFVGRSFNLTERDDTRRRGCSRLRDYVRKANLDIWLRKSTSFADFWDQIYQLGKQHNNCIPNERNP